MKKTLYNLAGAGFVIVIISAIIYRNLFGISVSTVKKNQPIYIPTGATYEQVMGTLESKLIIKNKKAFRWLANKKHYPVLIKPGRYIINKDLTYNSLINLLRSGRQSPVRVTYNNARTINEIAGKISKLIEADSVKLTSFFSDESNYSSDGFDKENIISVFIPNTYEFYWNTDAKGLYTRLLREYRLFWNDKRIAKAKEEGLVPREVIILASIIDDEVA